MLKCLPSRLRLADGFGNLFDVVGNFRNQDDIGSARQARAQSQPSRAMAHDLDDDNPIMAVGRAVQAVDGLGGNSNGGVKTKGDVGHGHVVVDRFGKGDRR